MHKRLVSILTPFRNTEEYLNACIDSVKKQSYHNWELWLIDDHSEDNSYEIASAFAEKDARIKLLKNEGSGIIKALQLAYNSCKGDFITRMDSDDIMVAKKLESMTNQLIKHGLGHIALGQVAYFSKAPISEGYLSYQNWLNDLTKKGANFKEVYKECVIASPCWMVYKEDLEKSNGFNNHIFPEDYDLVFRFYANNLKCIPSNQILHYWREYPTRTSRTSDHYTIEAFTVLKTKYFTQLDYNPNKNLVIWGAGRKAKIVAKSLIDKGIPFHWVSINPKKEAKKIYGVPLIGLEELEKLSNTQHIITIANGNSQTAISDYMLYKGLIDGKDYFFFC